MSRRIVRGPAHQRRGVPILQQIREEDDGYDATVEPNRTGDTYLVFGAMRKPDN